MFKLQILDNPSRSIWLVGEKVTLGSSKKNQMVLGSLGSEEFHAEIVIADDELCLNSLNGRCYVNGLIADIECRLKAGDVLRIGKDSMQIVDSLALVPEAPIKKPIIDRSTEDTRETTWVLIPKHRALKSREYTIVGKSILGRSSDCEISIPHKMLSREHAEIKVENRKLIVTDLDSSNSVYHNGIKIKQVEVVKGDTLSFANLEFDVDQRVKENNQDIVQTDEIPDSMNQTMMRPVVDVNAEIIRLKAVKARQKDTPLVPTSADEMLASNQMPDDHFSSKETLIAGPDRNIALIDEKKVGRWKVFRIVVFVLIATLAVGMLLSKSGII